MSNINKIILTILFIIFATASVSQLMATTPEYIGLSIFYDYKSKSKIKNRSNLNIDREENKNIQLSEQSFNIGAAYPIEFNKKTMIVNKFEYYSLDLNLDEVNLEQTNLYQIPNQLYLVNGRSELSHKLFSRWTFDGSIGLQFYSDFKENIKRLNLGIIGSLGTSWRYNKNLVLGLGLTQNFVFQEYKMSPYFYIYWENRKIIATLIYPQKIQATYRLFQKFKTGFYGTIDSLNFALNRDKYKLSNPNINYEIFSVGSISKIHLDDYFQIQLNGGYNISKVLKIKNDQNIINKFNFKKSWFFKIGFIYGI